MDLSLGELERQELGNSTVLFWQDLFFIKNMEVEESFIEDEKHRNFYEGYSMLQFPYIENYGIDYLVYFMQSSKYSGSLKTPGFGEKFDEDSFLFPLILEYNLWILPNSTNLTDIYPGLNLVLHFYVDVMLYGPRDFVNFK